MFSIISLAIGTLAVIGGGFLYWKSYTLKSAMKQKEEDMNRRMYELAILKELGDRIGYSLDVEKIIDVITGSLHQFIDYSAVSYMLLEPENIIFRVHLEKSVHRKFIDDVQNRMLNSLSALMDKKFEKNQVEEVLSGAILIEELEEPVQSFFNIPLIIGEKVVGILTVAHTEVGLYKEEEMTILYKITEQASHAVTSLQEVVETERGKLEAMVESMTEGVVMTDKEYRVMVVNPAAKKATGLTDKKEPTIFDLIDSLGGMFDIRGRLEESVKLNKIVEIPDVVIRDKFYQIIVTPVKSSVGLAKNETLGGVVIFRDITHEKEVEKLREDFTSMMVHELRSPLDNIKKISEVLRSGELKKNRAKEEEYLQLVFKDSSEMLELVSGLLDVAKLESGKFEVFKRPANFKELAEGRIRFFTTAAKDAKISLSMNIADTIPSEIEFDSLRITQVVNNLLSNAIKFTDAAGGVVLWAFLHKKGIDLAQEAGLAGLILPVGADTADLPNCVVVAVQDTGAGIPQDSIPELFQKFRQFRAGIAQGGMKGSGLGLAIAKGIVDSHGGTIGVVSEEGVGSTFYFTMPIEGERVAQPSNKTKTVVSKKNADEKITPKK